MPKLRAAGPAAVAIFCLTPLAYGGAAPADSRTAGFVMQNRAPFAALVGIPGHWPDATQPFFDMAWNVSSQSTLETDRGFTVFSDGETHALTARIQVPLSGRWRIGAQLPWIRHSGGFMDGIIDNWHDWFGLNEGIRPEHERNQIDYQLRRDGELLYQMSEPAAGVGDLMLGISGNIGSFEQFAPADGMGAYLMQIPWRIGMYAKLPTGDAEQLTGSGHADYSLSIGWRAPRARSSPLDWWLDLGITLPGDVDVPGLETKSVVWYYDAALIWRISDQWHALLQLAGNTAVYDGRAASLSTPVTQLALGGLWRITPRFGLRAGFFEDLITESAPDFGVEIAIVVGH